MKDIKFRAWNKARKQMAFFPLNWEAVNHRVSIGATSDLYIDPTKIKWWEDLSDLMQYIGFKDRNEKEICEGDYLKLEGLKVEVKWSNFDAGFVFEDWSGSHMLVTSGTAKEYEIIGNIYENSELLI